MVAFHIWTVSLIKYSFPGVLLKLWERDCTVVGEVKLVTEMESADPSSWELKVSGLTATNWPEIGPLHVCDTRVAWTVCQDTRSENRTCPWHLSWLKNLFPMLVALSSLDAEEKLVLPKLGILCLVEIHGILASLWTRKWMGSGDKRGNRRRGGSEDCSW